MPVPYREPAGHTDHPCRRRTSSPPPIEIPLPHPPIFFLRTADWQKCVRDAAERVRRQSQTSPLNAEAIPLAAVADHAYSSGSTDSATDDTDSSSSGGGAEAAGIPLRRGGAGATAPTGSPDSSDYDEEASFGYYGGDGGELITRGISGGSRAELSAARVKAAANAAATVAGERSKLLFTTGPPRRGVSSGSASSYCSSVDGSIV